MKIFKIFLDRFKKTKSISLTELPSRGMFYSPDFSISIKKASESQIKEYESKIDDTNILRSLIEIKKIIENNTIVKNGLYYDIKSIDALYIFFEIVKYTQSKKLEVPYFNDESSKMEMIELGPETFSYFDFEKFGDKYDSTNREYNFDGFKFSLPSIGIEDSMTRFTISKSQEKDSERYNDYSYNFMFFLNNRTELTFGEIDNLIQIFNFEMEERDTRLTDNIISKFSPILSFSLKKNNKVVKIHSKINLMTIWR